MGISPLSNGFLNKKELEGAEKRFPLCVFVCENCFLVQLPEFEKPENIFKNYAYFSSFSESWINHAKNYVENIIKRFKLNQKNLVIEIASNDGYLLQHFQKKNIPCLGIEPAENVANVAKQKGIPTLVKFFGTVTSQELFSDGKTADLLLGNNVLAHVPDINDFVNGMKIILKPNGVITMEFPHIMKLISENQFDTIYHEHLSYVSVTPLIPFFKKHGLEIFDVHPVSIHGGSLRIFVARQDRYAITDNVSMLLDQEKEKGIHEISCLENFASRVSQHRDELTWLLHSLKREGKRIAGISAPAKGMTLLNYCKIGTETLEFLTEKSSLKVGRYAPGNHLPIFPDKALVENDIDYALVLAWNFKDEIMRNQPEFVEKGGKFIIPIPKPIIV